MPNLTKAQVKAICALHHKKERDSQGLFIAEGAKLVNDLIMAKVRVNAIFCLQDSTCSAHENATVVQDFELSKLSQFKSIPEVVAIFYKPVQRDISECSGLVVYLQDIQDPGNMGTIVRTCDWFGVQHIVCSKYCADAYGAKAVQASMGSVGRMALHVASLDDVMHAMGTSVNCYAASMQGSSVFQVDPPAHAILVIGSEGQGIDESSLPSSAQLVTIPRLGGAESLNAATALGVILGQWCRQ
jgi:RNA methyltransferase, TrmH family